MTWVYNIVCFTIIIIIMFSFEIFICGFRCQVMWSWSIIFRELFCPWTEGVSQCFSSIPGTAYSQQFFGSLWLPVVYQLCLKCLQSEHKQHSKSSGQSRSSNSIHGSTLYQPLVIMPCSLPGSLHLHPPVNMFVMFYCLVHLLLQSNPTLPTPA